jgi:hypothetical protein
LGVPMMSNTLPERIVAQIVTIDVLRFIHGPPEQDHLQRSLWF